MIVMWVELGLIFADRTNGCAVACWYSVSSVCPRRMYVCTECIVAKQCVLQQKLLLTAWGA